MVATALGGPGVFQAQDVDLIWPAGPQDVLVTLKAAALNPADVFFRQLGGYLASDAPFVLGHDGMGVVAAVGSGVTGPGRGRPRLFLQRRDWRHDGHLCRGGCGACGPTGPCAGWGR